MNPALVIAIIDGSITMIEKLAPVLQELFAKGEISAEQQEALMKRMADLDRLELFSGPEWRVEE